MSSTPRRGGPPLEPLPDAQQPETGGHSTTTAAIYTGVQDGQEFAELRRSHRRFAFPMTAAFCAWYLLYVLLSSYATGFMSTVLFGSINVALVLGVLQFGTTFAIAWFYARYAGTHLDPRSERIKATVEERIAASAGAQRMEGVR